MLRTNCVESQTALYLHTPVNRKQKQPRHSHSVQSINIFVKYLTTCEKMPSIHGNLRVMTVTVLSEVAYNVIPVMVNA